MTIEGHSDMTDQTIRAPQMVTRTARTRGADEEPYLEVTDLQVHFPTADGLVQAVQGLTYSLPLRRTLAIVGESGSGKSVSSMAVMGLHDRKSTRMTGSIKIGGKEIVGMSEPDLMQVRGADAAMIFQDPQSSLHPYFTIGDQIMESYRAHNKVSKRAAKARAVDMLGRVGIPNPSRRVDQYPHEFSGGMRQRAMIAMALANDPKLLIADEPTTALDVTVQAQILELITDLQRDFGSAIVAHHPRPRRGGRDRRRRPGDVRRPRVEHGPVDKIFAVRRCTRTPGVCWRACRRSPLVRRAAPDPRHAAQPAGHARRLRLPPAVRVPRPRPRRPVPHAQTRDLDSADRSIWAASRAAT